MDVSFWGLLIKGLICAAIVTASGILWWKVYKVAKKLAELKAEINMKKRNTK